MLKSILINSRAASNLQRNSNSNKSIFSRTITVSRTNNTMRFREATVSTLAVLTTTCFLPSANVAAAWAPSLRRYPSVHKEVQQQQRPFSSTTQLWKASVVMADGEATVPAASLVPQETGSPIAKGSVVSFFKGGLAAVRINEDLVDTPTVDTAVVKSGLPVPAADKNFKSDAGTFGISFL